MKKLRSTLPCLSSCMAFFLLPLLAHADGMTIKQPFSTWHDASNAERKQLVDTVATQLSSSLAKPKPALPLESIMQCIDNTRTPDQMQIHGQTAHVTVGMVIMLCIKTQVPALRSAKYRQ